MTVVVATEPQSLVAVHDQCAALEAWAEGCESVIELRDATNKLAAIDEYLARTSTEGRGRVAEAMRRLEVRIGQLLGPAQVNGKGYAVGAVATDPSLNRHERSEFRQMAANPDVVETVIANSTDDNPASRRKVIRAIRGHDTPAPTERSWTRSGKRPDRQVQQIVRSLSVVAESIATFDPGDYRATDDELDGLDLIIRTLRHFRKSLAETK